jgi:LacI family transcriptional regulator
MAANGPHRPAPVTMRDVARAANVSQSTVSRVLSRSSSSIPISDETVQRVLEAVEKLGYRPNQYARSLRGQKTHLLAMMIADITNPFYHPMVRAVQDVAMRHGYDVLIANTDHAREKELLFCDSIIRRPVDGVLMVPYYLTNADMDRLIERTGAALAAVGGHIDHPLVDVAAGDDGQATYEAVKWLITQRGHRRIGLISVTSHFPTGERRYRAFLRAMVEANLPTPPAYIYEGDWSVASGSRAVKAFLSLPEPPTALFACNDTMAIGALVAAEEMGFRVPGDIAIVGFDDIPAASWVRPKLTTVAQFPAEMGEQLAKAIFERIDGTVSGSRRLFDIPCRFIERESA